jgi:hypothetical protein
MTSANNNNTIIVYDLGACDQERSANPIWGTIFISSPVYIEVVSLCLLESLTMFIKFPSIIVNICTRLKLFHNRTVMRGRGR